LKESVISSQIPRTESGGLLVDPVVGARGRFLLVLIDVDLEALAIAPVLPVSDRIADAIEERSATEIEPADEHSAEMADVAYVISGGPKQQGKKKLHRR
jgi:hypothetical protein